ncbi:MAG: helix-turn-helix domain-containing protein [Nanoarchaeota archaeon]|nr:helix-turn-helix domain-containing protein [Nanoarchaeota archaeon]
MESHENPLRLTLELFRQGKSVSEIAFQRKLAVSTIESHLQRLLESGEITIDELISRDKMDQIKAAISGSESLREIKDRLPDSISYGEIKYVLTIMDRFKHSSKKPAIVSAINTYIGNYCCRKCFKHPEIMKECERQLNELANKMKDTNITFSQFNAMMKDGRVLVCKLLQSQRALYVSWHNFERLKDKNMDFWDENGLLKND